MNFAKIFYSNKSSVWESVVFHLSLLKKDSSLCLQMTIRLGVRDSSLRIGMTRAGFEGGREEGGRQSRPPSSPTSLL